MLDAFLAGAVQERTIVSWIGRLVILAVCNWIWCKRAMLRFERGGVSITGELLHGVFGHGEVNISLGVIPLEVDATIEITSVVFDDVISLSPEGIIEVL